MPFSGCHHHLCRCLGSLTLSQWDGDDDSIASAHPETVACYKQGRDAHEREAQLASAWGEREAVGGVSAASWALPARLGPVQHGLTQHLADVGLDVHVLQVLVGVGVVQPQRGVQADGYPYPITDPCQLPHLALPPWVGIERLLRGYSSPSVGAVEEKLNVPQPRLHPGIYPVHCNLL